MKEIETMDKSSSFAPLVTGVFHRPWKLIFQYLLCKIIVILQTDILYYGLKQFSIAT